jgi:superfamily II DNA/RNA helicase
VEVEAGVPQGAVISPLLSNIYLHPFDQEMTKAGYALVRYGDDCLVLSPTRDAAIQALKTATTILQQVRLRLNPEAHLRSWRAGREKWNQRPDFKGDWDRALNCVTAVDLRRRLERI